MFSMRALSTERKQRWLFAVYGVVRELFCVAKFHNTSVKVASLLAACLKDNIYIHSLYNKLHFTIN